MSTIEDKIKIIDEIVKRHPAYGVENGWSYYVGGMNDRGDWYFRKMLDAPIEELQSYLDYIISEENKPKKVYSEQELADMRIIHHYPNGTWENEHNRKTRELFENELEKSFLGIFDEKTK